MPIGQRIVLAVTRTRAGLTLAALAYLVPLVLGVILVSSANAFALSQRDAIVQAAQGSDAIASLNSGDRLRAAIFDFAGNVAAAGITAITGLSVVGALAVAGYRGWVGGIVSVDGDHVSRLAEPVPAAYYLVTIILQLVPYILSGGAGIQLGIVAWRRRNDASVRPWLTLRIPTAAWRDAAILCLVALPLFLVASLFEFYFASP